MGTVPGGEQYLAQTGCGGHMARIRGDLHPNLERLSLLSFLELAHYWGPELGPRTLTAWAAPDRVGVGCG